MSRVNISRSGENLSVALGDKKVDVPLSMIKGYFSKVEGDLAVALKDTPLKGIFTEGAVKTSRFSSNEAISMVQTLATALALNPQLKAIDWKALVDLLPANFKNEINRIVDRIEAGVQTAETGINWTFLIVLLLIFLIGWWLWYQGRKAGVVYY